MKKVPPAKKEPRKNPGGALNRAPVFLKQYRILGNIQLAAEAAKWDKSMHYRLMRKDPKYRALFAEAKKAAIELLEDEAQRRAVHGTYRPIYWQGEKVGEELVYSDQLLQFLLRGEKPEKYRDRYDHSTNTNVNVRFSGGMDQLLALYHELTTQPMKTIDVAPDVSGPPEEISIPLEALPPLRTGRGGTTR